MRPFEVFQICTAVKLHFETVKYNCFSSNFRTKVSEATFDLRSDRHIYTALARKYKEKSELVEFLFSQYVVNPDSIWIGKFLDDEATKVFDNWKKKQDSLSYIFSNEVETLAISCKLKNLRFDEALSKQPNDNWPHIITLLNSRVISLETVCIVDQLTGFVNRENKNITESILWPRIHLLVDKYNAWLKLNVNISKMRNIVLSNFANN